MNQEAGHQAFIQLVDALKPWLDRIVIIGGWAHRLHRLHPLSQEMDYAPLITGDVDVALPADLLVEGGDIHTRLKERGFNEDLLGRMTPPVTHYRLGDEAEKFYVEFLTPLKGSPHDRERNPRSTAVIAGVVSQQLRHLDLLLLDPWWIEFPADKAVVRVQVANAASFLAQKLLIHRKRIQEERAKDILYIHDTLELFGSRLEVLREEWQERVVPSLPERMIEGVLAASDHVFSEVSDDIRRATLISPVRSLAPEDLRETCRVGLGEVFA